MLAPVPTTTQEKTRFHAQDRDPRQRAHPDRQDGRRPVDARRDRARRRWRSSAALERAGVEPEQVEHVVMGQVLQAGQGQIPSRQAQIKAGIPREVSSETINKVCASGLRASVILDQAIRAGDMQVGVGGGMESMSKAPYLLPQARFGYRMGDAKMLDAMVHDGLTNPFSGKQMFVEATEVGDELEMTRADLDRWALRSHELALAAIDEGRMAEEIVPVTVNGRKGRARWSRSTRARAATPRSSDSPRSPASSARRARTPPATRPASTTAPARSCSPRRSGRGQRQGGARGDRRARADRQRLRLPRHARPPRAAKKALEKAGPAARRHRPVGDQRGVRVGHAQLDPHARHRRGSRQRQRRRRRARPPDRRLRRAHPRQRSYTSCAAAAAASAAPRSARAADRATR